MKAAKVLAFCALFAVPACAQTHWREFASVAGNFALLFPQSPQEQTGAENNLHMVSVKVGDESYGLTYADYAQHIDWEQLVDRQRDSVVKAFGGKIVDEKRTSVEGYPGKWIRFVGRNVFGELAIYFVGNRLYLLQALVPKGTVRPENFSKFLNSFRLLSKPSPVS